MKRINVRLVTILFVVFMVGSVGWFALYRFQKSRQTGGLLRIVDQDIAEKRTEDALRHLLIYSRRQKDDLTQVNRLALLVRDYIADELQKGTLDPKKLGEARSYLDECARRAPGDVEVQEAMINFAMTYHSYGDAIDYLERLIERQGDKALPTWRYQLAIAYHRSGKFDKSLPLLAEMVGWDESTETFDVEGALAPKEVEAYAALATVLRDQRQSPRQADMVIEQMVRQNPDDYRSYVARIGYWQSGIDPSDEAIEKDIAKALSLAPGELNPLMLAGRQALTKNDLLRAQALFSQARELHPTNADPMMGLMQCAAMKGDYKKAISYADDALKLHPGNPNILFMKARLQLESKDFAAYDKTLAEYQRVAGGRPTVEYLRGRRHFLEGDWLTCTRVLSEVRHQLQLMDVNLLESTDRTLADAYGKLGQLDRQLESYTNILQYKPDDVQLRGQAIQCMFALKQDEKAIASYRALERDLASSPELATKWAPIRAALEIEVQKRLPESTRDWSKAESLVREIAQTPSIDANLKRRLAADLLRASGRTEQAQDVLANADLGEVNNAMARLGDLGVRIGNLPLEEALRKIDEFEDKEGVSLPTKFLRAQTIALQKPENARERLAEIEATGESLDANTKRLFETELSKYYLLAGYPDDAQRLWDKALTENPNDVQTYITIMVMSGQLKDSKSMESILRRMEQHLGNPSAEVNWGRALYTLTQYFKQEVPASQLDNAITLLDEAKKIRGGWPNIYALEGDIRLHQGRADLAIQAYERARQLGLSPPDMLQKLAALYFESQRLDDVRAILNEIPPSLWTDVEERMNLVLLMQKGELPEKIDVDKLAKTDADFVAVGRILMDANRPDESEKALRKALELNPKSPMAWSALFLKTLKFDGPEKARELLQVASDQVDEKSRPSLMGTSYRILGDFEAAEPYYKETLAKVGDNEIALQEIAMFYRDFKKPDLALPYIERILKDQKPHDPAASRSVRWARRALAQDASQSNDYNGYRQAVELIEQNAPVGAVLGREDMLLLGQVTRNRPELPSHQHLLEQLRKASEARDLSAEEKLLFAESSYSAGDWQTCQTVMSELLVSFPKNLAILDPWLRFLLERGDLQAAARWVENCPPESLAALRTRVHLDVRRGHTDRAIEKLKQVLRLGETREQQQQQLQLVASLAQELAAYDPKMQSAAEQSWKRLASMDPKYKLLYLQYLVNRRDTEKLDDIMALGQEIYDAGQQLPAMQLATLALSNVPKGNPQWEVHLDKLEAWIDGVNPDVEKASGSSMVILRAELAVLQGRPEQQEQILRDYLAKNTQRDRSRGLVLNNIAYILAIKGKGEEAKQYIDDAFDILGPVPTLHDTLGVVRLAQGNATDAVAEFQTAIDQGEHSPVVFLHLAVAQWKAGNKEAATDALLKGQEIGLEEGSLGPWEQPMLKQLVQDMKDAGVSLERPATPVNASEPATADAT